MCAHWLTRYDWSYWQDRLNAFPQYRADVDGFGLHFLHVAGEAGGRRPLLLAHGWPGSHFEFWGVIEKLAFPSRFGGSSADAFDLVIPSLPGFGFSDKPERPRGQRWTAALFNRLMTDQLGYSRYLAQGGDWGGLIASWLALDHSACVGAHLNMIGFRPTPAQPADDAEAAWLSRTQAAMQAEGAYFMQQATKPQTLAHALMDSPVGVAGWIFEKFHGWSDLAKGGGDVLKVHDPDHLWTNVMIYLITDSFATSVWYYRGLFEEGGIQLPPGVRCQKPTGFANFPGERLYQAPPRSWAERAYTIATWTDMPRGGHFAAMEEPDLLISDIRAFARAIGY
jgi:microsomal epoxide hydrolase